MRRFANSQSVSQRLPPSFIQAFIPLQPTGSQDQDIARFELHLLRVRDFFEKGPIHLELFRHVERRLLRFQVACTIQQHPAPDYAVLGPVLNTECALFVQVAVLAAPVIAVLAKADVTQAVPLA